MPFTKCLGCDKQKRHKNDKFIAIENITNLLRVINNLRQAYNAKKCKLDKLNDIPPQSKICKSCYIITKQTSSISIDPNKPDLSIYRKGLSSHNRCTFSCKNIENLSTIPNVICHDLLMNYKFLVPPEARMCSKHIGINNYWPFVKRGQEVGAEEQILISNIMFKYYHDLKENQTVFDMNKIDSINDDTFKTCFAYNKDQFRQICNYTKKSNVKQVGVLLCKLRTAVSNKQLAFLFGVCEQTIANYITLATEDLFENLVPKLINNNCRSILTGHNTSMAKILFDIPDDKACVIFDATYRLAQKSKNFSGQKQLWSEQKKMPLVKPMVGCTPDGWVHFVLGPFDATHNDASILEDCFSKYATEMSIIHEGDVILVDRDFRDVLKFLSDKGLRVYCPGLGQLDTLEANTSRYITKVRWIIEQVFGRLKSKFKIFALPAHNATLDRDYKSLQLFLHF